MIGKVLSGLAMKLMVSKGKLSLRRMEKSSYEPEAENIELLKKIIKSNKNTEFGRLHNFGSIRSPEDFRRNVPVSGYEDYAGYIERIKNGEKNVLASSRILGFSRTSATPGRERWLSERCSLKSRAKNTGPAGEYFSRPQPMSACPTV